MKLAAFLKMRPGKTMSGAIQRFLHTKIFLVMKLTAFLLVVTFMQVSAKGYSQRISLAVKNAPLEKVFREIEKQSGYSFWYKNELLQQADKITVNLKNVSLDEALKLCLENQVLTYAIVDHVIVIKLKDDGKQATPPPPPTKQIKGKVTAADGTPLNGVSVAIKDTKKGVTTNSDGEFTIAVVAEDVLVFSYVGFETKQVPVGEQSFITVSLTETKKVLSDVVVVGYGKQSRRTLASSISTVGGDDLNKGAITDVGQLLQGKVPGLNITASGDPNTPTAVILRGASTINSPQGPFYVIDGVPGADISAIAPDDIASVDVLKDAAATAIYGNRAANGVIMITTKRGKKGQSQFSYNGYAGLEKVSNQLKMMNASQLRAFLSKNSLAFSPADDKGANTNWQTAVERSSALSHNQNISFSGSSEHGSYSASLNYANKEGILQTSSLERIIGRLSIEHYLLNDKVKLGVNITNSSSNANDIAYRNTILLESALYLPVSPIKNSDGSYFEDLTNSNYYNPVAMLNNSQLNNKYNTLIGNFTGQAKLPFGLTYDLNVSYLKTDNLGGQYLDAYFTSNYNGMYDNPNPGLGYHSQQSFGSNGQATRSDYQNTSKILETYFTWNRQFGRHNINAVLGYSWQDNVVGNGFQVTTSNFPVDNVSYNNLALSNPYGLSGYQVSFGPDLTYQENRLISDFGRINYNYDEKYLLQASVRRDGSSVFGADNQWGYFPSVGAGWRISQEGFMRSQHIFNDLKLRGSYGVTGNASGFNAYTAQFISGSLGSYYYNGETVGAYGPTQAANPALKWEKTATTNIGLDYSLFKGRVSGAIDWYSKNTTGMIYSYKVDPILVPAGSIVANGGSMNNKGIEFSVTATVVKKSDFTWVTSLNLAHNKNVITSLTNPLFTNGDSILLADPEGGGQSGSTLQILKAGKPLGEFFSLEYAGKNASGVSQYIGGDGKLTTTPSIGTDYHYLGDAQPKLLLGWSNSFHYKGFDLNIFLRGVFGNKIFNATRADLFRPGTAQYTNILVDAGNESVSDPNVYKYSSRFIENGSYLRFDNATLAYNFKKITPYIKALKVYTSVNNLFVITGFKGVDPEVNQGGVAPGVDYNNFYPKTRTYLLGVNVTF
jgi:iron complex outermembrane receptor protein